MTLALIAGVIAGAAIFALWPRREVPVLVAVRCPDKLQAPDQQATVRVIR